MSVRHAVESVKIEIFTIHGSGNWRKTGQCTVMSTESDIMREVDFAAIIKDFAVAIEKGVRPLNV